MVTLACSGGLVEAKSNLAFIATADMRSVVAV